jgi:AcrR family transcriptional regulator
LLAAFKVASQKRLDGLTIRAIADEAKLSSGLVSFHFGNREGLLMALLDWLLQTTVVGSPTTEVRALPTAAQRLLGLLSQELTLLPERKPRLELFFDFWVLGFGHPLVRARMRKALSRYRKVITPLADAVVLESPERFAGVSGADLTQLVVATILGCVMQAIVDARGFDLERAIATLSAAVGSN